MDRSQWLSFFTKAGLPPNIAAKYSLIFSNNRIQLDMLNELSKEYLYDMGIRVVGDVIAILRYAKKFHTQMGKRSAIGNSTVLPSKAILSPTNSAFSIKDEHIPSFECSARTLDFENQPENRTHHEMGSLDVENFVMLMRKEIRTAEKCLSVGLADIIIHKERLRKHRDTRYLNAIGEKFLDARKKKYIVKHN